MLILVLFYSAKYSINLNLNLSEEEYLFAQEKMIARQEEKQVSLKEWNTVWMMYGAKLHEKLFLRVALRSSTFLLPGHTGSTTHKNPVRSTG